MSKSTTPEEKAPIAAAADSMAAAQGADVTGWKLKRRQFAALTWKNWIVLKSHWIINLLRCFLIPIAFYFFLVYTQSFLQTGGDFGLGTAVPIRSFSDALALNNKPFYYLDSTNGSAVNARLSPDNIISTLRQQLPASQQDRVKPIATAQQLAYACPQSFNGISPCFGAVQFTPSNSSVVAYNLRFDPGLNVVRIKNHESDAEKFILPAQLAIDRAIAQISANLTLEQANTLLQPSELPFTSQTNAQADEAKRRSLLSGINQLVVIAFLIGFLGVPYHLASDVSNERSSGMTDLLTSLGCDQAMRLLAWLSGPALAYFPAYIVMAGAMAAKLWTYTSPAIPIFGFLLEGLAMATFTLFIGCFFRKANLSAIVSTAITILLGIIGLLTYSVGGIGQIGMLVLGFIFPPMSFVYFFISVGLFELAEMPANLVKRPPAEDNAPPRPRELAGAAPLGLLALNVASVVLYFSLAMLVERKKFYPDSVRSWLFSPRKAEAVAMATSEDTALPAVSIRNLTKQYSKHADSLAVSDLSFDVAQGGITYLLGGNGSGKTTTLGMLSGTVARTSGEITIFGRERGQLEPGTIGLCPQKNVLYDELTTTQHVRLFAQLKGSSASTRKEKLAEAQDLLAQCDLAHKLSARSTALSGGQKRKLSLAMALAGRSKLILADESTSALDPLSRRAIWKILLAQRHERTVIATSHFLDEADFLADDVKMLAAPGKLLAEADPVTLRQRIGDGVSVHVQCQDMEAAQQVSDSLQSLSDKITRTFNDGIRGAVSFTIVVPSNETDVIVAILEKLESQKSAGFVIAYDAAGASMESVFLKLNIAHEKERDVSDGIAQAFAVATREEVEQTSALDLTSGRPSNFLRLAFVQFQKRLQVLKRSWFPPLLAVLLSVLGSAVALVFLRHRDASCVRGFTEDKLPEDIDLRVFGGQVLVSPPELINAASGFISNFNASNFAGISAQNFTQTFSPGGNWLNVQVGAVLAPGGNQLPTFAWRADSGSIIPIALLSLLNNVALRQAAGSGDVPPRIVPSYQPLSNLSLGSGLGDALKWAIIFALVQAVWPSFATLYPASERRSGAKGMLLTNGQRPLPLWMGHLLAEIPVIIFATVPIALIYGFGTSDQFESVGLLWVLLFLYGIAGTSQSFWIAQFTPNPLAAFAIAAAWNVLSQLIFIASVLSAITFVVTSDLLGVLLSIFWAVGIISPSVAMTRAAWVSANIFNLLCDGRGAYSTSSPGSLEKFGGPILYVVLWGLVAFGLTVYLDQGRLLPAIFSRATILQSDEEKDSVIAGEGVVAESDRVNAEDNGDLLKVQHLSCAYGSHVAVDNVSFGMQPQETFALCGPNGAGKSTTYSAIRGELLPRAGRVFIDGINIAQERTLARSKLSSVPQHDGLDDNLTVREHLLTYARVKGVPRDEINRNVDLSIDLTDLQKYRDRQAGALSGGNKRKLSLAIALMGNPRFYMLDELSSGVDAMTKRVLWKTLRKIGMGRAILMTTHSMEEVDALADRLAIQAGRLLAVGTVSELRKSRPYYEIQLSTRPIPGLTAKQQSVQVRDFVLRLFPGAIESDAASARFEVPLDSAASDDKAKSMATVADLYRRLANVDREALGITDFVVQPISLEALFLHIVRDANILEEGHV